MEGTHKEKEKKVGGGRIILYRVSPARRRSGRSDANWKRARAHRATRKSEDEISRKSNETKWGGVGARARRKGCFYVASFFKKKKKKLVSTGLLFIPLFGLWRTEMRMPPFRILLPVLGKSNAKRPVFLLSFFPKNVFHPQSFYSRRFFFPSSK